VDYDPADNAAKSYDAAIEAMREKLASFRREVIGDCTLYLGDCREIMPLLPQVDAVVMDPPYGIGWSKPYLKNGNSRAHDGIQNDGDTGARDAVLQSVGDTRAIVFGSFQAAFPQNVKQVLIWRKPGDAGLFGCVAGYRRDVEPIFLCGAWPAETVKRSSVLMAAAQFRGHAAEETGGHPHTKPVDLLGQLIRPTDAKIILDPFMGSGTTGVACVKLGRKFIGIEIDEGYFNVACLRIAAAFAQPDLFVEAPAAPPEQLNMLGAK
jgi:DNA modification methylase